MSEMHLGWHFCAIKDGKPVLRDGSKLIFGHTYEHVGDLVMCESGYHDSKRVIDALKYAPGAYLCRTLSSRDSSETDKHVSRYRIALAGIDATMILHEFAARIAFCALMDEREAGREPDARSWEAVSVKMRWCRGEATDEELEASKWSAADSTADSTADSAAEAAAEASAWAADSAAEAADSAAEASARAAEASARAAEASSWAADSAARSAAWWAAWSAAWSTADLLLLSMLPDELVNPALLEEK